MQCSAIFCSITKPRIISILLLLLLCIYLFI
jgi:hypothetical protein